MVVTFAQVASRPHLFRKHCARKSTLVILDEAHHSCEQLTWGEAIRSAFEPATKRLLLSGTPFRTDGQPIPFVEYEGGKCCSHVDYPYGEALNDGVCPSVYFPGYDGLKRWRIESQDYEGDFSDDADARGESLRLRAAVDPDFPAMKTMAREAMAELRKVRQDDPRAGGLVIARDIAAAKKMARLFRGAPVAVSDDAAADDVIEDFKKSSGEWLVSVRMVSEGIDIPRLRVLVYATNVVSELYFIQATGRLLRGNPSETVSMHIPADRRLEQYAKDIKDQRDGSLRDAYEEMRRERTEGDEDRLPSDTQTLDANGERDRVISDGTIYSPDRYDAALCHIENRGLAITPAQLLDAVAEFGGAEPFVAPNPVPIAEEMNETKKRLQRQRERLVGAVARKHLLERREVNTMIGKRVAFKPKSHTVRELEEAIEILEGWWRNDEPPRK